MFENQHLSKKIIPLERDYFISLNAKAYLGARNFGGVRSLGTVNHFKLNLVTFLELIESYSDEFVGMKEKVLVLSFAGNKAKSAIGQSLD